MTRPVFPRGDETTIADDGLVTIDDAGIGVSSHGRLLLRNIAMCFDAYLDREPAAPVHFSRAI